MVSRYSLKELNLCCGLEAELIVNNKIWNIIINSTILNYVLESPTTCRFISIPYYDIIKNRKLTRLLL